MNVRERLKEAYENVSFSADKTWTNNPNAYQKSNMDLYLTEQHVQSNKLHNCRPRSVRESIPKSRLAQYSDYAYNESREMSYASSTSICDFSFTIRMPAEPWEMPEVGELYKWFLKNHPDDNHPRFEGKYESPLLSVSAFEDKILKIQITEDRVKNVWDSDSNPYEEFYSRTSNVMVNLFTSPLKNVFLFNNDNDYNHEWFRNISVSRDFEQLEQLSQSFKEQAASINQFLTGNKELHPPVTELAATEVLYSEVLQGLSPSRKIISGRSLPTDEASSPPSQDSFTNYTVLNSHKLVQDEPKSDIFNQTNFPKLSQFSSVPQTNNKFVPQKPSPANVYFQTDNRYKLPVETVPRHKTMVHPSYIQQSYFYSPVQTVQRWIPPNFNSYYPTQIFTSNWFPQNAIVSNRIFGTTPTENRDPKPREEVEIETLIEDHPVSASISEELEIQALEQYSNSNENFYQELERQAAEQYEGSPE